MLPEKQRAIASQGGRTAHARGVAHKWDTASAKAAGKRGGAVVAAREGHMAELGRLGGKARRKRHPGAT